MNDKPPTTAPSRPRTRHPQKIASWVEDGPGSRLQAAIASSNSTSSIHLAPHAEVAQQPDVGRRAAEAHAPQPAPLTQDRDKARWRRTRLSVQASAFAFRASNSAWSIAPESRSALALAIWSVARRGAGDLLDVVGLGGLQVHGRFTWRSVMLRPRAIR